MFHGLSVIKPSHKKKRSHDLCNSDEGFDVVTRGNLVTMTKEHLPHPITPGAARPAVIAMKEKKRRLRNSSLRAV
jgi:hypothetical protein